MEIIYFSFILYIFQNLGRCKVFFLFALMLLTNFEEDFKKRKERQPNGQMVIILREIK